MNLEDTFYIVGIIYMGLGLVMLLALVIAVFAIKAKVNAIQHRIEDKFKDLIDIAQAGEKIYHSAKDIMGRK
jgi:hypothetical protein